MNRCSIWKTMFAVAAVTIALSPGIAAQDAKTYTLDSALQEIASYEWGKPFEALTYVESLVEASAAQSQERQALALRLAQALTAQCSMDGKQFLCTQLSQIGGEESVPALVELLKGEKTGEMALYALERNTSPAAEAALTAALGQAKGKALVGLLDALGWKKAQSAVPAMRPFLDNADPAVVEAAIAALGKAGGAAALDALQYAADKAIAWHATPALRIVIGEAFFDCAQPLADGGNPPVEVYKRLASAEWPISVREAAVRELAQAQGAPYIAGVLAGSDAKLYKAAAAAARKAGDAKALAEALPGLTLEAQIPLLYALNDRGDKAAKDGVAALAASSDEAVRLAAIGALGGVGDASSVAVLAQVAAKEENGDAVRAALSRMKGGDIDEAIAKAVEGAEEKASVVLLESLADRYAVAQAPAVIKATGEARPAVRIAALHTLAAIADEGNLGELIKPLLAAADDATRDAAAQALATAANRVLDPAKRAPAVIAAYKATSDPEAQCRLLGALGQIHDTNGLAIVVAAAKAGSDPMKGAALEALAGWEGPEAAGDAVAFAEAESNAERRVALLRGALRMLALPSERQAEDSMALYERVLKMTSNADEKKAVIAGLVALENPRAIAILTRCTEDPAVKEDAAKAIHALQQISFKVEASHGNGEARNAIDGKPDTRWTTGAPMKADMWYLVDLFSDVKVRRVVLDASGSPNDFPRGYAVYVGSSKEDLGEPVAQGEGNGPVTEITFAPKAGRYVKIVQTGQSASYFWSIHELRIDAAE